MEHDERVCPRCGKPAGEYRFCDSCRAHIDSLTRVEPRVGARVGDASDPAEQARQAVLALEQALAAAAEWKSDRVSQGGSAAVVQTEPGPRPAEGRTELPVSAESRAQAAREVARFEDVMTVAPKSAREHRPVQSSPPPAAEVEPAAVSAPPVEEVELTATAQEPTASVAPPARREAFWFELAPTLKSSGEAEMTTSVAPPAPASVAAPVATPQVDSATESTAEAWETNDRPDSRPWVTALFILALIALVALLTGRAPRR